MFLYLFHKKKIAQKRLEDIFQSKVCVLFEIIKVINLYQSTKSKKKLDFHLKAKKKIQCICT